MKRLSAKTLASLRSEFARPGYNRDQVEVGIVHLGAGRFHRAHQAVYTDDILADGSGDWAICAASLRSPAVRDSLLGQDCLYTVAERDARGEALRVIGAVKRVVFAPSDSSALISELAEPRVAVVTLTVTEKGYYHDPATGALQGGHPDIIHDLENPGRPRTVLGYLVAALGQRWRARAQPFSVLSCDNLRHNGRLLRGLVTSFAARADRGLARWIENEVAFPSTVVDRIVPATTVEDLASIEARIGARDDAAVVTEPFRQWIIEDRFCGKRPPWERAGAELVPEVGRYEEMKLRLLNGVHSTLAYLGYLSGYEYIFEAVRDAEFRAFIRAMMDEEITPTLRVPPGTDLRHYKDQVLERFSNPALQHRTWQIAMDGSQKLPERLLGTIRDQLEQVGPLGRLTLGVAGWIRYCGGVDEAGRPIDVKDPLAERLERLTRRAGADPRALAGAFLSVSEVFGDDGALRAGRLRTTLEGALEHLLTRGARRTVANWVREAGGNAASSDR